MFMSTVPTTNVPTVDSMLLDIPNIIASKTIVPSANLDNETPWAPCFLQQVLAVVTRFTAKKVQDLVHHQARVRVVRAVVRVTKVKVTRVKTISTMTMTM